MSERQPFLRGGACVSLVLLLTVTFTAAWLTARRVAAQAPPPAIERWGGAIEPVSLAPGGQPGNGYDAGAGVARRPAITPDGRYVAFASTSSNLVPGDTNNKADVFVRDRVTGTTTRVSVASDGTEGNDDSHSPAISADGRYVVFVSGSGLVPGDDGLVLSHVYLHDCQTGSTIAISHDPSGWRRFLDSDSPTISADGRFVAFDSKIWPSEYSPRDVYVCDRDPDGNGIFDEGTRIFDAIGGNADSRRPSISADGRIIAFESMATNLDPRGAGGVFTYDRLTRATAMVSLQVTGGPAPASEPVISADGRYVAFTSDDWGVVANDTNYVPDVFLADLQTGVTKIVSVIPPGYAVGCGPFSTSFAGHPSVSADGRYVAFTAPTYCGSYGQNSQVFVRDTVTETTTQATLGPGLFDPAAYYPSQTPDADSWEPAISADGRNVVFASNAQNLTSGTARSMGGDYLLAHHFIVTQPTPTAPANGGSHVLSIDTAVETRWMATEIAYAPADPGGWVGVTFFNPSQGSGTLTCLVLPNPGGARSATITIGPRHVVVTQDPRGFPMASVNPSTGGTAGGTSVTITGGPFLPGAEVKIGGAAATSVVYVGDGTLQAVTPPHTGEGAVDVAVTNTDGSVGVLPASFTYFDNTPPLVEPLISGIPGPPGTYIGWVSLSWDVSDPDSGVTWSSGCESQNIAPEVPVFTQTCTARSRGGETARTVTIRHDLNWPHVYLYDPATTVYPPGSVQLADYYCNDEVSGIQSCTAPVAKGAPFDTASTGFHTFTVTATSNSGAELVKSVRYGVGTGQCAAPPPGLVGWWSGDGFADFAGTNDVQPDATLEMGGFVGYDFNPTANPAYNGGHVHNATLVAGGADLRMRSEMTLSGWVQTAEQGVLFGREGEYLVAIGADGALQWSFANTTPGWGWVSTGYKLAGWVSPDFIRGEAWTHIAVTYAQGLVKTYVNGELVHTYAGTGDIGDAAPDMNEFWIGRRQDPSQPTQLWGGRIDEVQLFNRALSQAEIESVVLAGNRGVCRAVNPTLNVFAPNAPYAGTVELQAGMYDGGQPLGGRTVEFFLAGTSRGTAVTNSGGLAVLSASVEGLDLGRHENVITVKFAGDAQYTRAVSYGWVEVVKAMPTVEWPQPGNITYGTTLGPAQLNATANVPGTFTYSPGVGTVLPAGQNVWLTCDFTPDDTVHYETWHASRYLDVLKATPVISWSPPADIVYGTALGAQLNATANLPGTFSYTPSFGTVLNAGGGQTLAATFTPTDSRNYAITTATVSINVTRAATHVTWAAPADIVYGTPLGATQLNATASMPGTFTYEPPAGTVLNAISGQTLRVTFTPTDSANYAPATGTVTINVTRALPDITWPMPADIVYGTALGAAQLNASATMPGTFEYWPLAGTVLDAGRQTLRVMFTPFNTNYWPRGEAVAINVTKAAPHLTWATPADITFGTTLGAAQLNATADVPGTFAYTPAWGALLRAGAGQTLTAAFTPYNSNYATGTVTASINVTKASPAVNWATPGSISYGTPLGSAQLNATATVPGTFAYTPAAGAVLNAGAGQTLTVLFTPSDESNYVPVTRTVALTVVKATPHVTWAVPAAMVYGAALGTAQLNATADVPGSFGYTPPAGAVLGAGGGQTLTATFTPTDAANYLPATATVRIDVNKAPTEVTWATPADIVYGTPLGGTQLNAAASVPGTFAYNPPAGTVLNAGPGQALTVTFTPTDSTNYAPSTATVAINVGKAATQITWPPPADIVYGSALGAAQLNATANVPGTFTYDPAAGTVLNTGAGQTLRVAFTPTNAANYAPAAATVSITVTRAAAQISWSTPAAIVYGTPLGASQLNATASVPGTFTYSPSAGTLLNAGAGHVLTVTFTPTDAVNYTPATRSVAVDVMRRALVIQTVDTAKPFGAPLPSFSVVGSGFAPGDTLASLGGQLTFATSASQGSPVGRYAVTPGGLASPNYTIAFTAGSLNILPAATLVTIQPSANPSGLDQGLMLTAVVSVVAPGAGLPGGAVQFLDGGTLVGSATMFGGSASIMVNGLAVGSHALTAVYSGDPSFESAVGALTETVNPSNTTTTTTLGSSANPSVTGRSVTLTATVTMPSGGVTGTVAFYDGAALLGTASLSSGRATFATAGLADGPHQIVARYAGNGSAPPSVSPMLVQSVVASGVRLRSSTCTLSTSVSGTLGQEVVLLGSVVGGGGRIPTGVLQFTFDGALPDTANRVAIVPWSGVTAGGQLSVTWLTRGTHRIEVAYLGDGTFKGCTASGTIPVN